MSNRTDLKTIRTLLVWRAIGGDLHDVRVVLCEPRIDTHRVCLCTSVADRGVMRGRDGVRGVGNDADLVLTHRGGMRDEDVSRLQIGQRLRFCVIWHKFSVARSDDWRCSVQDITG